MAPTFLPPEHFTTWLDLLDHWQSLTAGLVAVFAAIIAIGGAEKDDPPSLAAEVRAYLDLFIRKREIIQRFSPQEATVLLGRHLKAVGELPSPIVFSASADRIGLLGPRIAAGLTEFYATYEALNLMVRLATTYPDRAIHRDSLEDLAHLFEQACSRALPLLAKLPREKADAALKKTIESFAHAEASP